MMKSMKIKNKFAFRYFCLCLMLLVIGLPLLYYFWYVPYMYRVLTPEYSFDLLVIFFVAVMVLPALCFWFFFSNSRIGFIIVFCLQVFIVSKAALQLGSDMPKELPVGKRLNIKEEVNKIKKRYNDDVGVMTQMGFNFSSFTETVWEGKGKDRKPIQSPEIKAEIRQAFWECQEKKKLINIERKDLASTEIFFYIYTEDVDEEYFEKCKGIFLKHWFAPVPETKRDF